MSVLNQLGTRSSPRPALRWCLLLTLFSFFLFRLAVVYGTGRHTDTISNAERTEFLKVSHLRSG